MSLFSAYAQKKTTTENFGLHFDKFPTPVTFACWKIRFKTEVCTCSQFPAEAVQWIKKVEFVDSLGEFRSAFVVFQGRILIKKVEFVDSLGEFRSAFVVFQGRILKYLLRGLFQH